MKFFRLAFGLLALGVSRGLLGQPDHPPILDFDFTLMASARVPDLAYVQLKPAARTKRQPEAADFEIIPVRVSSQGRSDLYHYAGPAPLRFVRTAGHAPHLSVRRVVAILESAASTQRTLIVLMPRESGDFELLAIDDGAAAFPAGCARVLNLTGEGVYGSLDGNEWMLPAAPKLTAPIAIDSSVRFGVTTTRRGRPIVVFDQTLAVVGNEQLLLVLLAPYRPGADIRTRVVRDRIVEGNLEED